MSRLSEAFRMVESFANEGVLFFDVTRTNVQGEKVAFRPGLTPAGLRLMLHHFIPQCWEDHQNFIVRPR
jgi:hypothetical protein